MTRVLQVIDSLQVGGAETVLLGLLELADTERTPMVVACVGLWHPEMVERVRAATPENVYLLDSRGSWDPRTLASLVRIIRSERIDVVQTHLAGGDFQGGLAARLTRRPCVSMLHSIAQDRRGYGRAGRVLAGFASRRFADRIVAVSEAVKTSHVEALGIPAERFVVLPNPPVAALLLDACFDRRRKRDELGIGTSLLLTTVSRLDLPKDHRTLLQALPKVLAAWPDLTVLVVGEGSLREPLASTARELGIDRNVVFAGIRLDAVELIAASDVFCHPALYEGFGLAVAEAMALGIPVVASAVTGLVELIDDGRTGLLVPPEDPDALAEALIELVRDPERRRRLGEQAREASRHRFDPDDWIRRMQEVYDDLLRTRPGRHVP